MKIKNMEELSYRFFKSHTRDEIEEALLEKKDVWVFQTAGGGSDDAWICDESEAEAIAHDIDPAGMLDSLHLDLEG